MAARITEITFFLLLFPLVFSLIGVWGIFDQNYYTMPEVEYQNYHIQNMSEEFETPQWWEVPMSLVTWAWQAIQTILEIFKKFFVIYPQLIAMFPMVPEEVWVIINFAYWFNFVLFLVSLKYPAMGEHV